MHTNLCVLIDINVNRVVKFLEGDYLTVQRCVKLTLEPLTIVVKERSPIGNVHNGRPILG